jgi:hypothetical protein
MAKWRIKAQTGHLSDSMLEIYIRQQQAAEYEGLRSMFAAG